MIIGSLTQTKRFEILHPDFKKVFEYVRSGNWQQVTAGKIILEEDKIWVNVDEVTGKSREAAKLEAHNRFIDRILQAAHGIGESHSHHGINHEINQGLAENYAENLWERYQTILK